jgi:transposase
MSRNSRRSANWPEADMLPATGSQELASSFSVGDSLSIAKIAEKLGCYPQTVRRRLHRFNTEGIDGPGEVKQTTTTRG